MRLDYEKPKYPSINNLKAKENGKIMTDFWAEENLRKTSFSIKYKMDYNDNSQEVQLGDYGRIQA